MFSQRTRSSKEHPKTCHSSLPTHLCHSPSGVIRCARSRCCQSLFVSESILGNSFCVEMTSFLNFSKAQTQKRTSLSWCQFLKRRVVFLLASHYLAELIPTYLGWGWLGKIGKNCLQVRSEVFTHLSGTAQNW